MADGERESESRASTRGHDDDDAKKKKNSGGSRSLSLLFVRSPRVIFASLLLPEPRPLFVMTAIDATTWIGLAVAVVAIVVVLLLRRRQANAAPATAAPPAKQAAAKPSKPATGAARAAQPKASKHEASGGRMRGRSKHEHPLWRSSLSEHTDAVTSVAFTPASARVHLVATSSLDRTVRIWSGQTLLSTDRRYGAARLVVPVDGS